MPAAHHARAAAVGTGAVGSAGHAVAVGTTAVGVVTMMAGTFAPWLASGTSDRNLYSSAGVIQRLAGLGSPVALALDALPLAGMYCVLAAVTYVMGRRRIAAGAIALLAVVLAAIAAAALAHRRAGPIHLLATGPAVTLVGAVVSTAGLALAAGFARRRRVATAAPNRSFTAPPGPTAAPGLSAPPGPADPQTGPQIQTTTAGRTADNRRTMEFR